jgi:hypothetical protein
MAGQTTEKEDVAYQADLRRGKRLRKLARMLNSRMVQQV